MYSVPFHLVFLILFPFNKLVTPFHSTYRSSQQLLLLCQFVEKVVCLFIYVCCVYLPKTLTVVFMHLNWSLQKYSIHKFLSFKWSERLINGVTMSRVISIIFLTVVLLSLEILNVYIFSFMWKL